MQSVRYPFFESKNEPGLFCPELSHFEGGGFNAIHNAYQENCV